MEAAVEHIEENRRMPIDRNPRQAKVDTDEQEGKESSCRREPSAGICRMQIVTRAIPIDGRE